MLLGHPYTLCFGLTTHPYSFGVTAMFYRRFTPPLSENRVKQLECTQENSLWVSHRLSSLCGWRSGLRSSWVGTEERTLTFLWKQSCLTKTNLQCHFTLIVTSSDLDIPQDQWGVRTGKRSRNKVVVENENKQTNKQTNKKPLSTQGPLDARQIL